MKAAPAIVPPVTGFPAVRHDASAEAGIGLCRVRALSCSVVSVLPSAGSGGYRPRGSFG
jgi:hypothetical protein